MQIFVKDIVRFAYAIYTAIFGTLERFESTGFGANSSTPHHGGILAAKSRKRIPYVLHATRIRVHIMVQDMILVDASCHDRIHQQGRQQQKAQGIEQNHHANQKQLKLLAITSTCFPAFIASAASCFPVIAHHSIIAVQKLTINTHHHSFS